MFARVFAVILFLQYNALSVLDANDALFALDASDSPLVACQVARAPNVRATARTGVAGHGNDSDLLCAGIAKDVHVKQHVFLLSTVAHRVGIVQ